MADHNLSPVDESPPSKVSVCMLASGSSGNSIYISDGNTSILVDAGLSGIELERRMKSRGLDPETLSAIVVSHEHDDHIKGVGILSRRFDLPVFLSNKTSQACKHQLRNIKKMSCFNCGSSFQINTININPFSISHDAEDPAGFTMELNNKKIGIATDLGIVTSLVKENLKACDMLIIEANHDPEMLINGPYPWHLKQRVKGRSGHLSNQDSRYLLHEIQHNNLQHVFLAHLSQTNNTPEKALNEVSQAIDQRYTRLTVSLQNICSQVMLIS